MCLPPANLVGVYGIHLDSLARGGNLPIPHDTPCDGSQNPVCSRRAELPPCRALHLCERIQYIGPNGPFEHHLEGLRFRFSFMVTWPSTAFASGL